MRSLKRILIAATFALAIALPNFVAAQQGAPAAGLAAQTDTGTRPYIPYDGAAENINLTNGNVNLKIPVVHLPGRNGFDLDLNLEYDSKFWKLEAAYGDGMLEGSWQEEKRLPYVSVGWHLNIPMINYTGGLLYDGQYAFACIATTTVILSDGGRYNFSNNAGCGAPYEINVMDTEDNSGAQLTLNSPTGPVLALRNGTKIYFPSAYSSIATKMVDANGNVITFNTAQSGQILTSVTDTLGRTVSFNGGSGFWWKNNSGGALTSISYDNSPNGTFTVALGYTDTMLNWYFSTPFTSLKGEPPVYITHSTGSSSRSMLTSANVGGHTFSFEYGLTGSYRFGELTKIAYPSGGYTTYSYTSWDHADLMVTDYSSGSTYEMDGNFHEVSQKQACTSSSDCATTYYNSTIGYVNNSSMEVVFPLPDGHKEVHSFTEEAIPGQGGEANHGLAAHETSVVTKSSANVVMQTITTTYSGTRTWDLPTTVQTQLDGLTKKYTLDYDTFTATYLPSLNPWVHAQPQPTTVTRKIDNVTTRQDYDWGQTALLRKTVTSYVHTNPINNQNYFSAAIRILNLPASSIIYDGQGNQRAKTVYEYDSYAAGEPSASGAANHQSVANNARGNLTAIDKWRNTDGALLETRYKYDDAGNRIRATDPLNHHTNFSYADSWGTPLGSDACKPTLGNAAAYLSGVTNHLNQVTTATYYSCPGRMQSRTDENNATTTYTYDSFSRMKTRTTHDGGYLENVFNDTPPVTVTTTTKITPTLNLVSIALVDGLGRLSETDLTSDPEGTVSTVTTYDGLDRTAWVYNPYRSTSDPTYGHAEYTYDGLGRVTQVTSQDSTQTTTVYTGNCSTVTDQAGKTRKSCVDGLGRLIQVFEAPNSLNYETDYAYDALDNLVQVQQKGGDSNPANWRTRSFTYDSLSRLLTASNPESGTISYSYDGDGNVLTKTSPLQNQTDPGVTRTISYCYDGLHRNTTKSYSGQSCPMPSPDVVYSYDDSSYNGLTIANGKGRRTGMTDPSGATAWSYDPMGRIRTEHRTLNGVTKDVGYTYNLDGSLYSLSYPSGRTVTYAPGGAGRPLSAVDSGNSINYATSALYAPQGAINSVKYGYTGSFVGITTTNSYNNRLQPVILSAASPTQTVLSLSYDFHLASGNNGNVWQIVNNRATGRTVNYAYDQLNRLTSATTQATSGSDCWSFNYGYDAWANLNSASSPQCDSNVPPQNKFNVASAGNNRFPGYCYDAAGNLINPSVSCVSAYAYDAENRLTSIAGGSYTYDGDGKRVKKDGTAQGLTPTVYWTGTGSDPLAESDLTGRINREYVFFNGKRIARVEYTYNEQGEIASATPHYYFSDHLGSADVVTNADGSVIEEESVYYPFGGELPVTSGTANHFKFTGKERDTETGLDYFIARHYMSDKGRFLQPDEFSGGPVDAFSSNDPAPPSGTFYADLTNPQSLNKYAYTYDNPLRYTDPDGHCPSCEATLERVIPIIEKYGPVIIAGLKAGAVTVATLIAKELSSTPGNGGAMGGHFGIMGADGDLAAAHAEALQRSNVQANREKGLETEKQDRQKDGLEKNNKSFKAADPKTNKPGSTIPDAMDNGQTVESKDIKRLDDSPQLRRQSAVSAESGQKARVIVNKKTKVSKTVEGRMDVERRD